MAIFKKNSGLGGSLSGKVGNLVFRQCGNVTYCCAAASQYTLSESDIAVADRQVFKCVNSFVKGVNQISPLRLIWLAAGIPGRTIGNKIIHIDKPLLKANKHLASMLLIPAESYFPAELDSFSMEDGLGTNWYNFKIKPLSNAGITTHQIETISLQGVLCCSEPDGTVKEDFFFAPLFPCVRPLDVNNPIEFQLRLSGADLLYSERYGKRAFLINLITYHINMEPNEASVNIYYPLN